MDTPEYDKTKTNAKRTNINFISSRSTEIKYEAICIKNSNTITTAGDEDNKKEINGMVQSILLMSEKIKE